MRLCERRCVSRFSTNSKFPDHNIEDRRQDQAEEGHSEHAGKYGGAERLPHLRTRTLREHEWQDAEDECETRHQNRAKSQPASLGDGLKSVAALLFALFCELYDATMRMAFLQARPTSTTKPIWVRILLSMPRSQTPASAASTHIGTTRMMLRGNDQLSYNAERMRKTNKTQSGKDEYGGIPRENLLISERSPLEAKAIRQRASGGICHRSKRLTGTEPRSGVAIHSSCRVKVVAFDSGGSRAGLDRKDRSQRNRSPARAARAKQRPPENREYQAPVRIVSHCGARHSEWNSRKSHYHSDERAAGLTVSRGAAKGSCFR